ncbi:serine/threonine-protein kinase [soil metagenome]
MFSFFRSKKAAARSDAKPAPVKPSPAPKLRKVNIKKRFTTITEIGQGSMSTVYKAVDNQSGRVVCLKVQDLVKTTAAAGRTRTEGRPSEGEIGLRIHHPNVVKTFEYGLSTRKEYWLSMEFVEGVSLQYVREVKSRGLPARLKLLIQAADGLAAIHQAGFIHHDFGPKNVLVDQESVAKIIDFGLAVPNTPTFQRPGNRTGTLLYMAPELIRRESTDERMDVFSFGIMAFELLTDRQPYDATDQIGIMRQRMNLDPMDIAKAAPDRPENLCNIIRKTLTRRKEDRIRSMVEVANTLREVKLVARAR